MQPRMTAEGPASLVERVRVGDAAAETELVQRYSRGIKAILRNCGADAASVDDLHQETFRIALEKIRRGDLRDPSGLSGFMASLARNLATQHFRRSARPAGDPAPLESLPAPQTGALDHLMEQENAMRVRQILDELGTERDREILRRFYLLSDEKTRICADLRLSSLQFNRVLYRARQRYRELYESALSKRDK